MKISLNGKFLGMAKIDKKSLNSNEAVLDAIKMSTQMQIKNRFMFSHHILSAHTGEFKKILIMGKKGIINFIKEGKITTEKDIKVIKDFDVDKDE